MNNNPESNDTQKDFFISYAHQNWDWAKWINEQLESAGYQTILPARDFPAGGHVILEMHKATHAKRTIAVLSPDYLPSKFTKPEWSAALYQDPTGERGLLLPVRILPAAVSGMLAPLIYIDLVGQEDKEKARKILLEGVEQTPKRLKPALFPPASHVGQPPAQLTTNTIARFGAPFPTYWNVSRRHAPYFTGHDEQIEQIFQTFNNRNAAQVSDPQAIVGLGGLGKTQTAAEYAYRYREQYKKAVLWARADTTENLMADFRSLAHMLGLPEQEPPIEAMHTWLREQSDWLLIFDNADDLQVVRDFLPLGTQRGHVLLTTRVRAAGNVAQPLLLEPLAPEDGALCILRRAGSIPRAGQLRDISPSSRKDAAIRLSELMDGLPLALEQAGAYIEDTGSSEIRYLRIYEPRRAEIIQRQYGALPNYPLAVATAWDISRSIVKQKEPVAFALLQCCAFLAPDAIPEEIFTQGGSVLGKELESVVADAIALDSVTSTLRKYSLLNREVNKEDAIDRFSMHRIIQEILRDEMDEATQQMWAERAVRAVSLALPSVEERIMQAQVRHCIPLIEQWNMTFPETQKIRQYAERIQNATNG